MHSSEGAKRQQQRFCGPSVALTFNFAVAVGIIMANKMVVIFFFKKKVYSFLYTRANFFFGLQGNMIVHTQDLLSL